MCSECERVRHGRISRANLQICSTSLQLRGKGNRSVSWGCSASLSWTCRSRYCGAHWRSGSTKMLTCSKQECQRYRMCMFPLIWLSMALYWNLPLEGNKAAFIKSGPSTVFASEACLSEPDMRWPSVVAGVRCWGESTRHWFPCSSESPSGFPSSAWAAAWKSVFTVGF